MVSVYVMCVMVMECMIQYSEMCHLVNRSWHTVCFAVYTPTPDPNAALNIYSPPLCFHPLNHNHDTKEYFMCYLVTGSLCVLFHSITAFNLLQ